MIFFNRIFAKNDISSMTDCYDIYVLNKIETIRPILAHLRKELEITDVKNEGIFYNLDRIESYLNDIVNVGR